MNERRGVCVYGTCFLVLAPRLIGMLVLFSLLLFALRLLDRRW